MLTEAEVQRSYRHLITKGSITPEVLERAEELVDELRAESPLRHRLTEEIDELRRIHLAASS